MSVPADNLEERLSSLVDDPDFKRVCERMTRFNVFEAMGALRSELRHSNFLSYVLSPSRNHALGPRPLQALLRAIVSRMPANQRPVRPLEIVVGDLDGAIVYRERANFDLLIEIRALNLVVLIENKIGASAGKDQLARYRRTVKAMYPDRRRLLVFLTPDGSDPMEEEFVAFDYGSLAEVLEEIATQAVPEIALTIRHYTDLLRRHIVTDPGLEDIARQIYQRHKEAFDFVFDCRPTSEGLLTIIDDLLRDTPGLTRDRDTSAFRRFVPDSWGTVPALNSCPEEAWTRTGRAVIFEIKTFTSEAYADRVSLILVVGPAPAEIRERLYSGAQDRAAIFKGLVRPMGSKWSTIYSHDLLTAAAGRVMERDQKAEIIRSSWERFRSADLPALEHAILEIASG